MQITETHAHLNDQIRLVASCFDRSIYIEPMLQSDRSFGSERLLRTYVCTYVRGTFVSLLKHSYVRSRYWFKRARRKYISVPKRRGTLVSAWSNVCNQVLSFPLNDNIALTIVYVSSGSAFTLDSTTPPLPRDIDLFLFQRNRNGEISPRKNVNPASNHRPQLI